MRHPPSEQAIQKIIARLTRLERAVFRKKAKQPPTAQKEDFAGPSGGARLLISKNFFKAKRTLRDVRKALGKNDYHYGSAQIQTALNRLSTRTGPLAASTEGGKKVYVRRK
jgi:hypothetical protein